MIDCVVVGLTLTDRRETGVTAAWLSCLGGSSLSPAAGRTLRPSRRSGQALGSKTPPSRKPWLGQAGQRSASLFPAKCRSLGNLVNHNDNKLSLPCTRLGLPHCPISFGLFDLVELGLHLPSRLSSIQFQLEQRLIGRLLVL